VRGSFEVLWAGLVGVMAWEVESCVLCSEPAGVVLRWEGEGGRGRKTTLKMRARRDLGLPPPTSSVALAAQQAIIRRYYTAALHVNQSDTRHACLEHPPIFLANPT
jgi:hypothetical protein